MKYFRGITNFKQAKEHYRSLAKKLHPDRGGSSQDFQAMRHEYALLLNELKNQSERKATKQTGEGYANYYEEIKTEMEKMGFSPEFIKHLERMLGNYVSSFFKSMINAPSTSTIGALLKKFM